MVAVRGSHLLNPQDFVIEQWCAGLKLAEQTEKSLIDAWYYARDLMSTHPDEMKNATLMLQSGVEMVEILHELNMDAETLLTAMLFPIVANKLTDWESLKEKFGAKITKIAQRRVWRWITSVNSMPAIPLTRYKWIMFAVCCWRWWTISAA